MKEYLKCLGISLAVIAGIAILQVLIWTLLFALKTAFGDIALSVFGVAVLVLAVSYFVYLVRKV